jgi:hypothetical protein
MQAISLLLASGSSTEPNQDMVRDAIVLQLECERPLPDRCPIDHGGNNAAANTGGARHANHTRKGGRAANRYSI